MECPSCQCQMPKCQCELPKCDCDYSCAKMKCCTVPACNCGNSCADNQCCGNKEMNEFYNYQTDADFDLNKNSVDINFTSTDYRHDRIDLDDFYTTGPAVKLAQERIVNWRKENRDVNHLSKDDWRNFQNKRCEICKNEYAKVQQSLDYQNALAYSYWKGLDVRSQGSELSVLKYKKLDLDEKVICVGCYGRSRDLKILAKIAE